MNADVFVTSGVEIENGSCEEIEGAGDGDTEEPPVLGRGSIDRRFARLGVRLGATEGAAIEAVSSAADKDDERVRGCV